MFFFQKNMDLLSLLLQDLSSISPIVQYLTVCQFLCHWPDPAENLIQKLVNQYHEVILVLL